MKLQSKKRNFLASFLILFFIPSHSAEFEINFIETFDENYMLEVIQELKYENNMNKMCNVFDIDINMNRKPIGRGYTVLQPQSHPWGIKNSKIHAHEFHYSSLVKGKKNYNYAFDIKRGYGINGKADGLIYKNTIASFSHLRSTDAFNWVEYFIKFVEKVNGTTNF